MTPEEFLFNQRMKGGSYGADTFLNNNFYKQDAPTELNSMTFSLIRYNFFLVYPMPQTYIL